MLYPLRTCGYRMDKPRRPCLQSQIGRCVAPCTGNTAAKIANAVTDTAVTMAVKSALRVSMPVVLSLATNDALGASCKNIGLLMNTKNIYFVPLGQDDPIKKPNSLVAHFDLIPETLANAVRGEQLQPVLR